MQTIDAVKELIRMGLTGIKFEYDKTSDLFYYDLNTGAKSHLHLFEDWHVEGRYNYSNQIEIEEWATMEHILTRLFWEFKDCIHGRDYYNTDWMEIGVKLGCAEKKVQTHTTISYE